jgi:hypothetical protein
MSEDKTIGARVNAEKYHQLKLFLLEHNMQVADWLDHQIDFTIGNKKQELANNEIPILESHSKEKKAWMMRNQSNSDQILAIKAGCEEWLQLIKLWNRGDLQR